MEEFESDGLFWLPENEGDQVAGRISFDHTKGVRLSLIGTFSEKEFGADIDEDAPARTIYGVAGKRYLTLTECTRSAVRFESPGFHREEYRSNTLFAGQALLAPDEKFSEVSVYLSNLYDWVARSAVSRVHNLNKETGQLEKTVLTLTPLEPIEQNADGCTIGLSGTWKVLGDTQNPGFEQDFSLRLSYETPVDFSTIRSDLATLQDLVSATTGAASIPTQIALWVTDEATEKKRQAKVNVYGQQSYQALAQQSRSRDTLLRLDDIGGLPAVARWLNFMRSRRVVLGLLLSSRYSKMYTENKFFNAVSAAETLHRMEFPNEVQPTADYKTFKRMLVSYAPEEHREWLTQQLAHSNEPRLRGRLIELAEYGGLSSMLNCNVEEWAKAVTNTRNRMVHHDEKKGSGASTTEMYWLAESIQLLVLLCLCKCCEFQDGYLEKIKSNPSAQFINERVEEILATK